jgi:DNA-binding GntR family transcriptional regulator
VDVKSSKKLSPIRAGSLRQQVQQRVFDAILTGHFQPGDPLRELDLARDLRVSQATVREALLRLESTGLVVRVPNKETRVTKLSQEELRERMQVRVILEPEAAVEAATKLAENGFAELDQKLQMITKALAKNAYLELAQADLEFHRTIWRAANETIFRILDNLTAPMFAFTAILRGADHEVLSGVVNAHEPIVEALRCNDPVAIRASVRNHIEASYGKFLSSEWEDFHAFSRPAGADSSPAVPLASLAQRPLGPELGTHQLKSD